MTPLRAPVNASSANIDPVPSGSHIAVCDIIAFLGVQPGTGLYPKPKPTIYLRFQLPNERVEFEKDGKKQSGPRMIGNCYTFSMHEKANLRHLLESWRGQQFTDEQAADFDISTALGGPCMLMVMQSQKGQKIYSNISGIGPLPKGINPKTIIVEGTPVLYGPENTSTYKLLPNWLQEKIDHQILKEPEPKEGEPAPPPRGDTWDGSEPRNDGFDSSLITDDDIPF
jgi:hypothetical protein